MPQPLGAQQGHELARRDAERDILQHRQILAVQDEAMVDAASDQARADRFSSRRLHGASLDQRYHWTRPFCQASSRSRTRNSTVINVEHINAMTSSAPYMLA